MAIKGLDKLNSQLDALKGIKTSKALLAGAYVLMGESQRNAPVDTGYLRDSHEAVETAAGAEMRINADYAYYQEVGTESTPAKGFVRQAIDEHTPDIVRAVGKEINDEMRGAV